VKLEALGYSSLSEVRLQDGVVGGGGDDDDNDDDVTD
jgi:hypothetical protein